MTEQEKINALGRIHFKEATLKAMKNQLLIVDDPMKETFKLINVEDIPLKNGMTLDEFINKTDKTIKVLTDAIDALVEVVNNNQSVVNDAINDLREDIEKGKLF